MLAPGVLLSCSGLREAQEAGPGDAGRVTTLGPASAALGPRQASPGNPRPGPVPVPVP